MSGYPVRFGKYMLLERVNVGGMAEVFKAKTFGVAGFERILAIKRILPSLVEDQEFIHMFIDEARIAVQLNHTNIAQIYELGKQGLHYYIAMEYLPSRDLRGILDRLRSGGQLMPIAQAAYITAKICEGLDYAHRRRDPSGQPMNIVHRDVSPQNVLVTYEGDIKVIDFGIAKAANRASKTQAGVLKGKFGYMSPEQVRGLPIDRRSDIFAVGVLLYEMVTGERLFIAESDFSTLERVRNAEVIPPSMFNKKVTPELEQVVLRSLAREAEDRYQWASDLAEDLQRFLIEDRTIFNPKRLAAYMKEAYAVEIAEERAKMEEFLSISMDDSDKQEQGAAPRSEPRNRPPVPMESLLSMEAEPDEGVDYDGEDRTYVLESSEAGRSLEASMARPSAPGPSAQAGAARLVEPTHDDPLSEASLYGEEESDLEDDAATQVAAVNPFDENPPDTMEGASTPPRAPVRGAASTRPPMRGFEDFSEDGGTRPDNGNLLSLPPPPVPFAVDDGPILAPRDAREARPASPPLARPAVSPPPRMEERRPPPPEPLAPAEQKGAGERSGPRHSAPPPSLYVAGALALVAFLAVSAALYVKLSSGALVPLILEPPDLAQPLPTAQVYVDDEQVAQGLPAWVTLEEGVSHQLRVEAEGFAVFELPLPKGSHTLTRMKIPLVAVAAKPDDGDPPSDGIATEELRVNADVGVVKEGGPTEPSGAAEPSQAAALASKEEESPQAATAAAAATPSELANDVVADPTPSVQLADAGPWRVSFTAIADGASLAGARVYRDGAVVGITPFEAELASDVSSVRFEVRAEGYAVRQLEIERRGRGHVGPSSLRLLRPSTDEGAAAASAATDVGSDTPPGEGRGSTSSGAPPPASASSGQAAPTSVALPTGESTRQAAPGPRADDPSTASDNDERRQRRQKTPRARRVSLALGTRPIAQVIVDGDKIPQTTPLMGARALKLRPGDHTIQFVDTKTNNRYRYKVTLPPDSPSNKLIIILGGDIRVKEGTVKAVELK